MQSTIEPYSIACYYGNKSHCHKVYVHQEGDYVPLTKPSPSDTFKTHILNLEIHRVQSRHVMDKVLL